MQWTEIHAIMPYSKLDPMDQLLLLCRSKIMPQIMTINMTTTIIIIKTKTAIIIIITITNYLLTCLSVCLFVCLPACTHLSFFIPSNGNCLVSLSHRLKRGKCEARARASRPVVFYFRATTCIALLYNPGQSSLASLALSHSLFLHYIPSIDPIPVRYQLF